MGKKHSKLSGFSLNELNQLLYKAFPNEFPKDSNKFYAFLFKLNDYGIAVNRVTHEKFNYKKEIKHIIGTGVFIGEHSAYGLALLNKGLAWTAAQLAKLKNDKADALFLSLAKSYISNHTHSDKAIMTIRKIESVIKSRDALGLVDLVEIKDDESETYLSLFFWINEYFGVNENYERESFVNFIESNMTYTKGCIRTMAQLMPIVGREVMKMILMML